MYIYEILNDRQPNPIKRFLTGVSQGAICNISLMYLLSAYLVCTDKNGKQIFIIQYLHAVIIKINLKI